MFTDADLAVAKAMADDLELLAILHDREPSAELLSALHASPIQDQLSLRLLSSESRAALDAAAEAVAELPRFADAAGLDELASDFADVYLRHVYRAAPTESVWLTEEGIDRQGPMLAIRALHRRHGVTMIDRDRRPEDHLVPQLRFAAHLLSGIATEAGPSAAARFLDAHLLKWIHQFAARLVQVEAPPYFTALAVLTACYIDEARDHLATMTGIKRPPPIAPPKEKTDLNAGLPDCGSDQRYVPGVAPSW